MQLAAGAKMKEKINHFANIEDIKMLKTVRKNLPKEFMYLKQSLN